MNLLEETQMLVAFGDLKDGTQDAELVNLIRQANIM